ncbi:putative branched-subunit amino acid permease [Motilibacter peucedani]|uniref:Putative branched-subunit amino acid permease n=1 Tax=Motilibacter peucedani TaxID=598650 RepID=A0A420XRV5_9ACTN|nr:AzlC family ABC transporter permease [Motilibacter peucedani]RKS77618.1 putative branched-subunit amino acid permease [Motilibacter peucedani]
MSSSRRSVALDGLAVGVATGAYGLSFGAVSVAAGLGVAQTAVLSAVMFTGGSQFALVGVLAGGGSALGAAATAVLLGSRNAFYGLRLASLLRLTGVRRLLGAHLVIDESTAMAVAQDDEDSGRLAFWVTGAAVYVFWNLLTVVGALGAQAVSDPRTLGLDAAAPAAFLALLAPRLRTRRNLALALLAGAGALLLTPVTPAGVPILVAGAATVVLGLR